MYFSEFTLTSKLILYLKLACIFSNFATIFSFFLVCVHVKNIFVCCLNPNFVQYLKKVFVFKIIYAIITLYPRHLFPFNF